MRFSHAGASDVGRKRDHNEDSFLLLPEESLYCVADGMGGHASGEVAARIAVEEMAEFFRLTGRDGMGFQWGGGSFVMAHAIGEQKPWATCLTAQAIRRRRPNLASRAFVENLEGPVRVYSAGRRFLHRTDLAVARNARQAQRAVRFDAARA